MYIVGGILSGLFLICFFMLLNPELTNHTQEYLSSRFSEDPMLMVYSVVIVSIPLIVFSIYLFIHGHKVIKGRRFPVAGEKVIRETRILKGAAAIRHGRIIQCLSVLIIVASVTLPLILWQLVQTITDVT